MAFFLFRPIVVVPDGDCRGDVGGDRVNSAGVLDAKGSVGGAEEDCASTVVVLDEDDSGDGAGDDCVNAVL